MTVAIEASEMGAENTSAIRKYSGQNYAEQKYAWQSTLDKVRWTKYVGHKTPDKSASDKSELDKSTPDESMPNKITPDKSVPDESASDESASDKSAPNRSASEKNVDSVHLLRSRQLFIRNSTTTDYSRHMLITVTLTFHSDCWLPGWIGTVRFNPPRAQAIYIYTVHTLHIHAYNPTVTYTHTDPHFTIQPHAIS